MKSLSIFMFFGVLVPILAKEFNLKNEVQDINLDRNLTPKLGLDDGDRAWRVNNLRNNPKFREFLKEQRGKFRQFYRQLRQQNLTLNQRRRKSKDFRREMRQQQIQFLQSLKSPNQLVRPERPKNSQGKPARNLQWKNFLRRQRQQYREFRQNLRQQNLSRRQIWAQIRQFRANQKQEKRQFLLELKAQQNQSQGKKPNPILGLRPTRRPWRPAGHARPMVRPQRPVMAINVAKENSEGKTKRLKKMMKKRMIKMEKKREKKAFENFVKELKQQKNLTKEEYTEKMQLFKKDLMKKRKEFLAKMG